VWIMGSKASVHGENKDSNAKPAWRMGNLRKVGQLHQLLNNNHLVQAYSSMQKKGFSDGDIEEALRENYGPIRETTIKKHGTVRDIAFNKFSQTLETSRRAQVYDGQNDSMNARSVPISGLNETDVQSVATLVNIKEEQENDTADIIDLPQPSKTSNSFPSSTVIKKGRPNLKVLVTSDDELDGPVHKDGKEGGNTPRTPLRISPGGGLHVGAFTINASGTTMLSPEGHAKSPHPFLRGGERDFIEIQLLGKGAQGSVSEALHIPTLTIVAIKTLPVFDEESVHHLANELDVLYKNLAELKLIDGSLQVLEHDCDSEISPSRRDPEGSHDNEGNEEDCDYIDGRYSDVSDASTCGFGSDKMAGRKPGPQRRKSSTVESACPQLLAMYDGRRSET
jgi:hypothetical protein